MLVDHERVLLDLKQEIAQKSHHGQRDLLALVATLEAKHRLDEGLPERMLRLYGVQVGSDFLKDGSSSERGRVPAADDPKDRAQRGDSNHESEEDTHVGISNSAAAVAA